MSNGEPVSFLDATYRRIYPQDFDFRRQAEARLNQLTMPHWALGDLMDLKTLLGSGTCAAVLEEAGHHVVPGAVDPGQADHHQRQD